MGCDHMRREGTPTRVKFATKICLEKNYQQIASKRLKFKAGSSKVEKYFDIDFSCKDLNEVFLRLAYSTSRRIFFKQDVKID
ncbi:MAG: hypothetical protein NZT61_01070 [Deltaproteobacteria bacterium]|nr:hypothetical protein [Deltaproteobacteria bacterium]MCX7952078.1 hypothetical protein [Deltaproteobacteria bacterium]